MTVPHEFLITLIKQSNILEKICEELQISVYGENGEILMERIHTLQTVYAIHEKNFQPKAEEILTNASPATEHI